ncbi:hypothetical protein BS47DRAFT_1368424 [Hydnum rufescens UP504]|uniref:Uncharacterized protein n=1 Tax=Hydnum rufescens UP504 TaxID=1448309 RepID=A0A9P6AGQ9_9AGAM|nr:hypothetical protein BS47DRAFT_1368424 [Hydnum rufescens UP504]
MAEKICKILAYPHSVQQLMSGKATPILSGALLAFQSLHNWWQDHEIVNKDILEYVFEGLEWLNKYHEKGSKTYAYMVTMALNPNIKLSFITQSWDLIEQEMAVEWVKEELSKYREKNSDYNSAHKLNNCTL